ncbi:flavin reductase family protein [Halobacillus amylolyticus]|uniref:Flavin reductase family protein n=1 Tax=Halobacillus amylolyticus TaxID=2932259 RepID=A0ABY4H6U3_9BACI|nr:flavin reductase family protein [Halobacillus amylolyticus]UOR10492.1 flavin reductase family protein [Halobacillus amylolyticus]
MIIQRDEFHEHNMSKLIKGAVVPRPIAWVSSLSNQGIRNLAPFSFFTVASMDPITLCFSVGSEGRAKDTLTNVRETGQFVVNIVSETLANQMYESSKTFEADEDEFKVAGLKAANSTSIQPPRVKEAPVSMECELDRIIEIGTNHLILGKVVCYHIQEDIYTETDKVDPHKLAPVGRMAGDYTYVKEFYRLPNDKLPKSK